MTTTENSYDKQAADFVAKTGLQITKKYLGHRVYFDEEGPNPPQRAVWEITFAREGRRPYSFTFGASIVHSYTIHDEQYVFPKIITTHWNIYSLKGYEEAVAAGGGSIQGKYLLKPAHPEPHDYDVLACLDGNELEGFKDWCADYGYNGDSIKARDLYIRCGEQVAALRRLFSTEELEELGEIQ